MVDLDVADDTSTVETVVDVGDARERAVEVFPEYADGVTGAAVEDEPPVVEDDGAVADLAHGGGVVGDEDDRPSLGLELTESGSSTWPGTARRQPPAPRRRAGRRDRG